jgi:hypothetical protein
MRGIWRWPFEVLAHADPADGQALNSMTAKAPPFGGGRKAFIFICLKL